MDKQSACQLLFSGSLNYIEGKKKSGFATLKNVNFFLWRVLAETARVNCLLWKISLHFKF